MFRKLILAGVLTASFTAPAFAEWYVLKPNAPPATAEEVCMVVDRTAAPGETQISGPFATEAEGLAAAKENIVNCTQQASNDSNNNNNDPAPN